MKLSYAILTHNEGEYIEQLLRLLVEFKEAIDEIVVVDDYSDDELTVQILQEYKRAGHIKLYQRSLGGDFGAQKNFLMSKCTGDFIFNIDADELPVPELLVNLKEILQANPEVDLYAIPRKNYVYGLTDEHIKKWHWRVDDSGLVNWPDNQMRIIKNNGDIKWENIVHEVPSGFKKFAFIPNEYALIHEKTISRQEQQNSFYDTI